MKNTSSKTLCPVVYLVKSVPKDLVDTFEKELSTEAREEAIIDEFIDEDMEDAIMVEEEVEDAIIICLSARKSCCSEETEAGLKLRVGN